MQLQSPVMKNFIIPIAWQVCYEEEHLFLNNLKQSAVLSLPDSLHNKIYNPKCNRSRHDLSSDEPLFVHCSHVRAVLQRTLVPNRSGREVIVVYVGKMIGPG